MKRMENELCRNRRWPLSWVSWKPWLVGALSAGLVFASGLGGALSLADEGEETGQVPELVDINTQAMCPSLEGLPKDVRSVKGFSHEAHAEKYLKGNGEFSLNKYDDSFTCSACHTKAKVREDLEGKDPCEILKAELSADGNKLKPKDFFHKSCLKCHKNMKKAGKATGPTSCKGCHGRK